MKPPICIICNKDFRNDTGSGGLVSFKLTEEQVEFNKAFEEKGITGHPAGTEWFCSRHYSKAQKYQHLYLSEAIDKILKSGNFLERYIYRFLKKRS